MPYRRGFSLVELVMIMIIISILSSIAVPRLTHASASAQANALIATLVNVREAAELYFAEHGSYPGYTPGAGTPDGTWYHRHMLEYSNDGGNTQGTLGYPYIYGPYLREPFPKNPINGLDTVRVIASPGGAVTVGATGWVAVLSTGEFRVNSTAAQLEAIGVRDSSFGQQIE